MLYHEKKSNFPTKPGLDQILIFHMLKNTDNIWIQIELEAISNNTTDDVVVKADGKIGNSLSSQQHFVQFVTRPIHEKKELVTILLLLFT